MADELVDRVKEYWEKGTALFVSKPEMEENEGIRLLLDTPNTSRSTSYTTEPSDRTDPGYESLHEDDGTGKTPKGFYTVADAIEAMGFGKFQWYVFCCAGVAWVGYSMQVMVITILGPVVRCEWEISAVQEALLSTVVFVGDMFGSPIFGALGDKFTRKQVLFFTAVWALYFGTLSGFSPIYFWLMFLRLVTSFCLGGVPQAITYFAEMLPNANRGKWLIFVHFFWAIGACVEVLLAMIFLPTLGWEAFLIASGLPMIIVIIVVPFMPLSPCHAMVMGNHTEAKKSLDLVAKMNKAEVPSGILVAEKAKKETGGIRELLTPKLRVTTIFLWIIWFVGSFSYIGSILMSTAIINEKLECITDDRYLTEENSNCNLVCKTLTVLDIAGILVTTSAEIPGVIITAYLIDRLGRKNLLILESFCYTVALLLMFVCVGRGYIILLLFVARCFISSVYQLCYVYTPEVYPTHCRALGMGICSWFGTLGGITTPFAVVILMDYSVESVVLVYALLGVIVGILTLCLPYETSGRSLGTLTKTK